jgi:hypothetical protein
MSTGQRNKNRYPLCPGRAIGKGAGNRYSTFRELAADKRPGRFTGRFEGCTCERPPFRPRDAGQGNVGSYPQRPTREEMGRYSFASADAQSWRPWQPSPYFGECLRALAQLNSDEQRGAANVTSLPSDGARAPDAAWAADSLRPRHPPAGGSLRGDSWKDLRNRATG